MQWITNYLTQIGYPQTVETKRPRDNLGRPVPWYTYPAIEYLNQLDFSCKTVFEYGSGSGSLYWADKARFLTSVEHDSTWYAQLARQLRPSQKLVLATDPGEYARTIRHGGKRYDVIIIDGIKRLACAQEATGRLKKGGMIILDNSDWYRRAGSFLRGQGLMQVDFSGLGPVNTYSWTTSIFFSPATCLRPVNNYQPADPIGGQLITPDDE